MIKFDNYTMLPPPMYIGLSTEDKPTEAEIGSKLLEVDTSKIYYYDGEWIGEE